MKDILSVSIRRRIAAVAFVDIGPPVATACVTGMGRSGTTWAANIVNHDRTYRLLFEPFNPRQVRAARPFNGFDYLKPGGATEAQTGAAARILDGRIRCTAVDRHTRGFVFRRRLVKVVRCNLMLAWLADLRPAMPIALVIRHPLAVARSWLELGWGIDPEEPGSDFALISSQERLLEDYPVVGEALSVVDPSSFLDRMMFLWCVQHFVPLQQFAERPLCTVFYEDLVRDPERHTRRLIEGLHGDLDPEGCEAAWRTPSVTDSVRATKRDGASRMVGWKAAFTPAEIDRATELLAIFGLEHIYGPNGYPAIEPDSLTANRRQVRQGMATSS